MTAPKAAASRSRAKAKTDSPEVAFTLDQLEAQAAQDAPPPLRMGIAGRVIEVPSPMDLPLSSLATLAASEQNPIAAIQLIEDLIGEEVFAELKERGTSIKVMMALVNKVQDYYDQAMQDAYGDPKESASS